MSRLAGLFKQLEADGRTAVIPYVVAGDPNPDATVPLMHDLVAAGADVLEVGVPFSDPMSEGPVIQQGHERALEHGVTLTHVLSMVTQFRERDNDTPIVLMGYANPVERMGYEGFADRCRDAGIDGLITVDLPPEEVDAINEQLQRVGIDNIFLISPTTPEPRIATITQRASGFIYYVAVKGVTGAGNLDTDDVASHLARIRATSKLPIAVGFGIKDAASAAAVASMADGVVVGSALIKAVADARVSGESEAAALAQGVALIEGIRRGVDGAASAS